MKKAFTLIELMMVVAILALLCAICATKVHFEHRTPNDGNSVEKTEIQKPDKAKTSTYTCTVISD